MNQQDEYFMIEFNEKMNNGKKITVYEKNKAISLLIWGTVINALEPPKKIGENKYQQIFTNGLKVDYSYSKDGKDLIIEYEFKSVKKSEEQDKKDKKDNKKTEDIFEIMIYKTGKIVTDRSIYETGEVYVSNKSWKVIMKISDGVSKKEILNGDYECKISGEILECKNSSDNFKIRGGFSTKGFEVGSSINVGVSFEENPIFIFKDDYSIIGGNNSIKDMISEIQSKSKGKKLQVNISTGKNNKLCYPVDCGFRNGEPADSYWIKTLAGAFGSGREKGRKHAGIDFYAPIGTPVYAIADGIVLTVNHFYEGAYSVVIEHSEIELNGKNIARQIRYGEMLGVDKTGILYGKNNDRTFDYIKGSQKGDLTAQIRKCIESIKMINITPGMKVEKGDIIGYVGVLDSPGLLLKVERELSEINNLGNYYKSIGGSMLHLEMYAGDEKIKNKPHSDVRNKEYNYVTVENYQRRKDLIDPTMFFGIKKDDIVKNFEIKQDKKIIIYEEKKGAKKKIYIGKNCKEIPERYIKFE